MSQKPHFPTTEQDMPDDYKKSANKRPQRVSVEDKKKHQKEASKRWQQK